MTPRLHNTDFQCGHCRNHVSCLTLVSGVQNRNHCPCCLWSRHMDLYAAGDRLSACKALMRPIGLTIKRGHNKYATCGGELMVVHACVECGRYSINRIAADDDLHSLLEVYAGSNSIFPQVRQMLLENGIRLLDGMDEWIIRQQLRGNQ